MAAATNARATVFVVSSIMNAKQAVGRVVKLDNVPKSKKSLTLNNRTADFVLCHLEK